MGFGKIHWSVHVGSSMWLVGVVGCDAARSNNWSLASWNGMYWDIQCWINCQKFLCLISIVLWLWALLISYFQLPSLLAMVVMIGGCMSFCLFLALWKSTGLLAYFSLINSFVFLLVGRVLHHFQTLPIEFTYIEYKMVLVAHFGESLMGALLP